MTKVVSRWLLGLVCLGLVLALALPVGADPQERWLPFDGVSPASQPALSLLGSSGEAIDLAADLPGAWTAGIQAGGRDLSRLYGDGYGHPTKVGMPDLPVLRRDVEIPFGARVTVELVSADWAEQTLAGLDLDPIYPLQPSLRKTEEPGQSTAFQINDEFYTSGGPYPISPVALGEAYTVRGHRVQPVEVWPVAYDPAAGTLRLYRSVTFRLRLSGGEPALTQAMAARYASSAFESRLAGQIINYNQGMGARPISPDDTTGYLIITADAYYGSMLPFVTLKEGRGYDVTMTKTSEIPNGGTTTGIKAYIQEAYDTWPLPPSFVLLVGDTDTVPTFTGPEIGTSTDLYYGCMDGSGDWHPDLGRGRFPVRSAAQTTYMVDKYLAYAGLTGQEPWIKAASFPATCDDYQTAEGSHNYVVNNHTLPNGYTGTFPNNPQPGGDKLYCVTYNATHQNLIDAFNLGRWAIIYSGHGSYSGWEMSFTPTDVRNLTNDGMFPFVASHACLSGDFGETEVFGETWVLEPNQGALVFWGSSTYSYWGEDDILERRMFDNLFNADPHPTIAEMTDAGLVGVESSYPSMAQYYWETYNVLGDPAAKLFLEPDLPTFTLAVDPAQHEVCSSGTAHSTVTVGSIMNYNGTVGLSTAALPPGISAAFTPPSAPAPFTSDLALGVAAGTPAGDYPVTVLASDGSLTLDAQVAVRLRSGSPAAPLLVSPADGATDQALAPVLDWDAAQQATTYSLQLAKSPLFTAPVVDVTGIPATAFATLSPLDGGTCYWWHVQGENACGVGPWAEPFHFATVALANGFSDDMESGSGQWTHQAAQGIDHWAISTAQAHSPTHAWFVPDDSALTDTRLWNTAAVPVGAGSTLTFWHRFQFEGTAFDGSVLEISTDGGASWADLGAYITANGYNGTIESGYSNPLAGRAAWTGDLTTWTEVSVNLSAFSGQSAQIRWRLGCDSSVSDVGWYIDDVQITAPLPPNPAPTLTTIDPGSGSPEESTPVTIAGTNFAGVPSLRLGATWLLDVVRVSPTQLTAVVPAGMAAGTYDLVLYNGDCQQATLPDAFTVTAENTVHVHAMKLTYQDLGGRYVIDGQVQIVDQYNARVTGALVTAEWTLPDGSTQTRQALTRTNGVASFRAKSTQAGTFRLCVANVAKAGYLYDPEQNRVSCRVLTIP